MASISSNRAAVARAYHELADAFNLRRSIPGSNKRLGDELIDTAVGAIENRTVNLQQDVSGKPLAPLKWRTRVRKARLGLDPRILIETHEMLSPEELRGRTTVGSHYAVMQAGTSEEVQAKVEHAHTATANRAERPFYDLGRDGERAVDVLAQEVIVKNIKAAEQA